MGRWGRQLFLLVLVLAVLAGAAPAPAASGDISDGTGPLDTDADLAAALRFEKLIPVHTVGGAVTGLDFDKWPHLDPTAKVTNMSGEGDSGNYTGVYLAAQSWRYAQAKKELRKLHANPLSTIGGSKAARFWRAQRDEASARGREMVEYYHVLTNIAASWQTELDPHIDDSRAPDDIGYLDFGGGLVPGEKGLLMRICTPEKLADPAKPYGDVRINNHGQRTVGPLQWEGEPWWCVGATSRDSYAGTLHGMGVALDYLANDENADLRNMLARDLMAMADYAIKYAWFQPRPHGEVAIPGMHNDLDGPISPLFIQVPLHRLHLLQLARHASKLIGDVAASQRYEALWVSELAASVKNGALDLSMVIDSSRPHEAQYKYQLHLVSFFNLIRLEQDPTVREDFKRALGIMDASTTDDGNAYYEALIHALTGERPRLDEAVQYHREWLDYYALHEEIARLGRAPWQNVVRCGLTEDPGPDAPIWEQPLECVPMSETHMHQTLPDGSTQETVFTPADPTDDELRALRPIPVRYRRYADFLWQKDPTKATGDHFTPWRGPSIDFLGTYWLIRYFSEADGPLTPGPLPAWPGPTFS